MAGHAYRGIQGSATGPRRGLFLPAWLGFAVFTFTVYVALVVIGSGDLGLLWIVGFVIVGWPTLAIGTTAGIMMRRGGRTASSFARLAVPLSLLAWGVAAILLEFGASTEYIPATLLWIAAPTALSALVLFFVPAPSGAVG